MTARVLIIAGSDSGGGAGIQADIKTVTMLGGHAMTAITAITAQNTLGVQAVMPVPAEMVIAQIESVVSDIGVDAIKIGMIGSAETAHAVADVLETIDAPVVFDPVMIATSGDTLADESTVAAFERLIRLATVITPNTDELEALTGVKFLDELDLENSAGELAERYHIGVLATGTRISGGVIIGQGAPYSTDSQLFDRLFVSSEHTGFSQWEWNASEIDTPHTHGTGCTLASGIATGLGQGLSLPDAVDRARQFVRAAILAAPGLGRGHGPMGHALGMIPFDAREN